MASELKDNPSLQEDALTIRAQADRCRDILREMGKTGKDDLLIRAAPLSEVLREAAEPHSQRGKMLHFHLNPKDNGLPEPFILRRPEIIHGLRNLIQNAVDFASANVWIEGSWSAEDISVVIIDDGAGFPLQVIGRIGDPFLRMDGQAVFKFAVRVLDEVAREVASKANLALDRIDWLIPHQANLRILSATARKLGIDPARLAVTVDRHGNTSAASIPLALDEYVRSGRIKRGQNVLLSAVGGGFTWGAILLET
jgi:hypothetical protein